MTTTSPSPAHGLDHVGLVVRDADAAITWYRDSFGYVVEHDERILGETQNVRLVFLVPAHDPQATAIQLVSPFADGPIARYLAAHGEGLHHVCLAVPDVERAVRALGDGTTAPFVGGKGRRCAFPAGVPNDVRLELVEAPTR